jgi:epoxyqueuosine reductase
MNQTPSNKDLHDLAENIRVWARELGFQQVGISDVDPGEHEDRFIQWLGNKYQGNMDYMGKHGSKRYHPDELVDDTSRVLSLRMDYLPEDSRMMEVLRDKNKGYISRYTLGRDYHKLIRKRLNLLTKKINDAMVGYQFRAFVDSAPVLERAFAQKGGLGWFGKSSMIINRQAGTYFFLGEIFTNIPLPVDPPYEKDHCGQCTACLDMCPTNAFVSPYVLDARRCISYLTIELKGSIPEDLRPLMGNRIFGCDDCQLVCPWNRFSKPSTESDFSPRQQFSTPDLLELFSWNEEKFLKLTEGSAIRRAGHESWLRNIAIALGNAPSSIEITEALKGKLDAPSDIIKEHVKWALDQHCNKD